MTAIVLCADAVLLACGQPLHPNGQCYDIGDLKELRSKLTAPPVLRAWVDQIFVHPDLPLRTAATR